MDSIRDFKKISFREIEQAAFRIACKTQIEAMRILLEDLDDEIHRNRDKKRYKSLGLRERTDYLITMKIGHVKIGHVLPRTIPQMYR
jgi:hypothetical protein